MIGFGLGTAWLARSRDRQVAAWAVFGAVLGPVAIILLWAAPPGRCATCRASVRGWLTTCQWCGKDVRGGVPSASPALSASTRPADAGGKAQKTTASAKKTAATSVGAEAPPRGPRPVISVAPTKRPIDTAGPSVVVASGPPVDLGAAAAAAGKSKPATTKRRASKADAAKATPTRPIQIVTTGIYMTGTIGLSAGSRYSIQHDDERIQVLGPGDRDPKAVAFERSLIGIDATGMEGRLILTAQGGRGGTVLVFSSVEGGDPASIAATLTRAALAARPIAS